MRVAERAGNQCNTIGQQRDAGAEFGSPMRFGPITECIGYAVAEGPRWRSWGLL